MSVLSKFLIFSLASAPEERVRLKRNLESLIVSNEFLGLKAKAQQTVSSKFRLLLLAPFAWNGENAKKPAIFFMSICPMVMLAFGSIWVARGLIDMLLYKSLGFETIVGGLFIFVMFPMFLVYSIEGAIQGETNPGVARLRCWLILKLVNGESSFRLMKEIESEVSKLAKPVSNAEYRRMKAASRKLNRLSMILFVISLFLWLVLFALSPSWIELQRPLVGMLYICSIFVAAIPSTIGAVMERTRTPILLSMKDMTIVEEKSKFGWEPNVDEVVRNYKNSRVQKKLSRKAKLIYWFGPLCAWDDEKLGIALVSLLLSLLYVVANIVFQMDATRQTLMIRAFTALSICLIAYCSVEALISGGGKQKATERRGILKSLKDGCFIDHMIPLDELIEHFSDGSYMKNAKESSVEDFLTKLYVKSVSNSWWLH